MQVIGASQKGISVPPGLSITALSQNALKVLEERKTKIPSYFSNFKRWLPIMEAYEGGSAAYFATPSVVRTGPLRSTPLTSFFPLFLSLPSRLFLVHSADPVSPPPLLPQNLIYALEESLKTITTDPSLPLEKRFTEHARVAKTFRAEAAKLGLKTVALSEESSANGMTALYLPEGVTVPAIVGALSERGVVIAGGLHKDIVRLPLHLLSGRVLTVFYVAVQKTKYIVRQLPFPSFPFRPEDRVH